MAQKIIFLDDHSGAELEDSDPVVIRVGDTEWTADLSEANRQKIITWIAAFIPNVEPGTASPRRTPGRAARAGAKTAGARVTKTQTSGASTDSAARTAQRQRIADWVKGLSKAERDAYPEGTRWVIGSRGRLDHAILREFYAAQPDEEKLFTTSG